MAGIYGAAITTVLILVFGNWFLTRNNASSGAAPVSGASSQIRKELSGEFGAMLGIPSLSDPVEKKVSLVRVALLSYDALLSRLSLFELFDFENGFYALCTKVAETYQGELDRFDGRSVTIVFNRLLQVDDHSAVAVRAALTLRKAMLERLADSIPEALRRRAEAEVALAVTTGHVVAGPVGVDYRKVYTTFGPPVTRLESLLENAVHGDIIVPAEGDFGGLETIDGTERVEGKIVIPKDVDVDAR